MELDGELLLASAVQFLLEGGDQEAARFLLPCSLDVHQSGDSWWVGDEERYAVHVHVSAPRRTYDLLVQKDHPVGSAIRRALEAVIPAHYYVRHFTVSAQLVDNVEPAWRRDLIENASGTLASNQGADLGAARVWNNLRFRSESEIKIAQALDKAGVLYLPNCRARLGPADNRVNREADFLVCYEGKWGILEVDGEPFHPPSRTAQDHERDRLFKLHGVLVVEHFDARECWENPSGVVTRFLRILKQA